MSSEMDKEKEQLCGIRNELKNIIGQSVNTKSTLAETANSVPSSSSVCFNNKIHPDRLDRIQNSESSKRATFLHATASRAIDDDIQRMRSELVRSYELFQNAGEAFDSINFNCLSYRIRDLHLSASQTEIDTILEEKTVNDSLNKLTDIMGHRFRQHPGEFSDIPELSTFYKACSQLQHGLEALKRQRCEMNDLGQRMTWATKVSTERSEEIQKAIDKQDI